MKAFQRVAVVLGAVTLCVLLWKMDPAAVAILVLQVGWGMALIVPQEAVAHLLNALGWRFAFSAHQAPSFPLRELLRLRVAGDAINYLTPSGTIAGEIARTTMLNESHGTAVRAAAVLVAKCTQTLGQILFALAGLVIGAAGRLPLAWRYEQVVYEVAGGFALVLTALALYEVWAQRRPGAEAAAPPARTGLRAMPGWLRHFFRKHPGRFTASTLLFLLAYAWGAFEAYWICRFLGVSVSLGTAMTIEVLSVTIDGILFMVPAKVGTQEGGKTAIFAALGLPPISGFAFGVVRHVRELVWAGLGLLLCSRHQRPARPPEPAPVFPPATSPQ